MKIQETYVIARILYFIDLVIGIAFLTLLIPSISSIITLSQALKFSCSLILMNTLNQILGHLFLNMFQLNHEIYPAKDFYPRSSLQFQLNHVYDFSALCHLWLLTTFTIHICINTTLHYFNNYQFICGSIDKFVTARNDGNYLFYESKEMRGMLII